jgi:preprotein translocase subunit SecA
VHGDDDFWNYVETVDWTPQGLADTKLETELTRIQDTAEEIEAETRISLARFDSIIDHHRNATYSLRRSILTSDQFLRIAFFEFHTILFREPDPSLPHRDIDSLLRSKVLTAEENRRVTYFIHGEIPTLLADVPPEGYTTRKDAILAVLDEHWKRYLDNIDWLQGWISLTSVARHDPYVEFAMTGDRMFHDMRRSAALAGLKLILHI